MISSKIFILIVTCFLFLTSCKKDEKQDVQTGYSLKLISGFESDIIGQSTSIPLVVQLLKDGNPVGLNAPFFKLTVVDNICSTRDRSINEYPYSYKVGFNTDGTASINWYTGEKVGKQAIKIQLLEGGQANGVSLVLASLDFNFNLLPSQNGWVPTCMNDYGFLLKLKNNKVLFFTEKKVISSIDNGRNWQPLNTFSDYIRSYNQDLFGKYFFKYVSSSNSIFFYTTSVSQENGVIYKSTDEGNTWQTFNIQGVYYHIDVAKDSTYILCDSKGLWAMDTLFKPWKALIPAGGFIEFEEASNGNCFALDFYGELFKANSLYEKYNKLSISFTPDNFFIINDIIYAFEKNKVYISTNFGASFTQMSDYSSSSKASILKLEHYKGQFYIVYFPEGQQSALAQVTTTLSWLSYEPLNNSINKNEPFASYPNFSVGDDGSLLIQQQNHFFQYKP